VEKPDLTDGASLSIRCRLLDRISPKFYTMQRNSCHFIVWNPNCDIAICFRMAAWEWGLVREKRRFFDFNWLPWQRPLSDRKVIYQINKPFQPSTNPEILVKISPLDSEIPVLERRPLIIYKIEKKTSAKYITHPARLPSGLNKWRYEYFSRYRLLSLL